MTDFLGEKRLLQPHLPLLIEAAINISLNTDLTFNVREVSIYFLEQIGDTFAKHLYKKHPAVLKQIIDAGFKLACEDDSEYPDEEESPHSLSLYMLHNYAIEVPLTVIYPVFKENIVLFCSHQSDPLVRKAGLKILGHLCDSDGLLDGVKEDIDLFTDILVAGMQDPSDIVREAAALVVGQFSEHVVPDFLERHAKIVPVLFKVLQDRQQIATVSADHALHTEKAIYSVKEFIEQMHETEVKPYLETGLQMLMPYLLGANQKRGVRYMTLLAVSSFITAAEREIMPHRDDILKIIYEIVNSDQDQELKGAALLCAGNLAQACGKDNFPMDALEAFTKFGLVCI
jgi:hypothetical protein